jgi:hypothetical protein
MLNWPAGHLSKELRLKTGYNQVTRSPAGIYCRITATRRSIRIGWIRENDGDGEIVNVTGLDESYNTLRYGNEAHPDRGQLFDGNVSSSFQFCCGSFSRVIKQMADVLRRYDAILCAC